MNVYYKETQGWTEQRRLWDGVWARAEGQGTDRGLPVPGAKPPLVAAFAGAGGKTSLIRQLAAEGRERRLKVLVTTTTHMFAPRRFGVFSKNVRDVEEMLDRWGIAVAGEPEGREKIRFPGLEFYEKICPAADLVLVEADGSKRLPLKVPGPGEPVIPWNANLVLCVFGLSALGQPGEQAAFRLEQVMGLLERHSDEAFKPGEYREAKKGLWTVTPGIFGTLMRYGYLEPLREEYPGLTVRPVFNQADTPRLASLGRAVLEAMGEGDGLVAGQTNTGEGMALF
ncbi:MAG: putative selenium-dependent hydroxylase accessory protein YqeC [Clostridium sp.]|nr:putative selenium-dependent hydroxylase accessory protein YqeC [Clostridium sp.]